MSLRKFKESTAYASSLEVLAQMQAIQGDVATLKDDAVTAKTDAEAAEVNAETAQSGATSERIAAEAAALAAAASSAASASANAASNYIPAASGNVPRGILTVTVSNAGTGGTNATNVAATFAGGNFTVNPAILFDVVAGAVTNVRVTGKGLYVGAAPTAPTATFPGSGAGFAATLDVGFLFGSGASYWTDHPTDTKLAQLYLNNAGAALAASPVVTFTKSIISGAVACTPGGSGAAIALTPLMPISGTGLDQVYVFNAQAQNTHTGSGYTTISCAGVFSGAAAQVVLGNGDIAPERVWNGNLPVIVRPVVIASVNKWVLLSPEFARQQSVIWLINDNDADGRNITARLPHAGVKIPTDGSNVVFKVKTTTRKTAGGPTITVKSYDGLTTHFTANIYDRDNVTLLTESGVWEAHDTLDIIRLATGRGNLVSAPDRLTKRMAKWVSGAISETGQLPSSSRPVAFYQTQVNEAFIDVRPHDSHYHTLADRRSHDMVRFNLFNMRDFQSDAYALTLNSYAARFNGIWQQLNNLNFDAVAGETEVDTGQVPSTPECVLNLLAFGSGGSPSLAGIAHNDMSVHPSGWTLQGVINDTSTTPDFTDTFVDLTNPAIGTVFQGDKIISTAWYYYETTTAQKVAVVRIVHTFESAAIGQCRCKVTVWGDDALLTAVGDVRSGSYVGMVPARDCYKAVGQSAGVFGTHIDINQKNGSVTPIPAAERYYLWDDKAAVPDAKIRFDINSGTGFSHLENGTGVPFVGNSTIINNEWGAKLYINAFSAAPKSLAGITMEIDTCYSIVRIPTAALA